MPARARVRIPIDYTFFKSKLKPEIQDTKKLQEFCCGLNIWSEKAADIFNIKEEDKEIFLSDPKIRPKEEYPGLGIQNNILINIYNIFKY